MRCFACPALAICLCGPALAAPPEPGLYEIGYRLEMPHLERYATQRSAQVCIADAPMPVMSGNGAFEGCDISRLSREDSRMSYELVCAGRSGARASARYRFHAGGFAARIAVKLGAKNMTLLEIQSGRRLGDCR